MERTLLEREFDADDSQLHEVLDFLTEELEKRSVGMKHVMALSLALEEAFVNIAHYAYEGRPGKVKIGLRFEPDRVLIILKDNGMAFDPLSMDDPDISAGVEERKIGGLGIYMIKKSTDLCTYERVDGYNVLTMIKILI
jgi:anti-sigma regulatory factor (Ser/Thr protein kinase)